MNGALCSNILSGYSCGPCPLTPTPSTGFNCERSCSGVIDLVFVLDDSGTVHLERWQYVLQFVINVVQNLDISPTRTQVGVVFYSDQASNGFCLNQFTNRQDVIDAINNTIPYSGNTTNTAAGLRLLRNVMFTTPCGDRPNAPNYAIVVANGDSTVDSTLTIAEGVQNRLEGTTIFTVGVEPQEKNSSELQGISSFPRNLTNMYVPSFSMLPASYGMVVSAICQNVNYCAPNPCQNGGTCQSQLGQYVCTCPTGITGTNCERTCNQKMDIVFILDNSGSVQEEYQQSVNFTRLVVSGLDVNSGNVRVGAIAFSDQVVGQFFMNQQSPALTSAQAVYNSLDFYNRFSTTNTPAALEDAYSQQFTAANGDRPGVPNFIVIVTDGNSNVNQTRTIPDAVILKNANVTIYSIAVGLSPQWSELDGMASTPSSEYVIPLPTIGDITATANILLNELCGVVIG
jgi:collagen type VI alpha